MFVCFDWEILKRFIFSIPSHFMFELPAEFEYGAESKDVSIQMDYQDFTDASNPSNKLHFTNVVIRKCNIKDFYKADLN